MSQVFSNNRETIIIANSFNSSAPENEAKIHAWLSPLEPWVRHRDIGAQRVDSVGGWLLETEDFKRWHSSTREDDSDHSTFFCDGNPGAGKSYIISLVIDKLCDDAEEDDAAVVCFYFDFAARSEQSPVNMFGSLLRQLIGRLDEISEVVVRGFRKQKKVIGGRGLQVSGILKMFQTITATRRTFICVDALDECVPEHRIVVLESLGQILRGSPNTRLFMTGRPHVRSEVERKLGKATFVFIKPTEDGIIRFLREKLRNDTAPHIMSSTLEANIMKSIPEISSETFLLASFYIEAILRETTVARRGKRLKSVKDGAGLGDAYGVTLERIRAQDGEKKELAMATLTWICHSERPLQVDELCHALAVEIGSTDFDLENIPSITTLLDCCQGLITVDKEASTVRLIHFTVQEYLCAQSDLFNKPHSMIAETCLTYLNSEQLKSLPVDPLPDHRTVPFLKYSSRYWGTHASRELSHYGKTLAVGLLKRYEDHVSALSLLKQVLHPSYIGDVSASRFSGLHCACYFGIVELVIALLNSDCCPINQGDWSGSTPFLWAAWSGHEEVVKVLLERGDVDPNHPDAEDRTPLGWAAVAGHETMVKLLLGLKDVDPNRVDKYDLTPLACAASNGHEDVVKLLLERDDVDPNCSDVDGRTPLGRAALEGHEGVVRLLLGRENVDSNHRDVNDRTPLLYAALQGYERVAKLLLDQKDVDPNRIDKYDLTPLVCATWNGHEEVIKLLLGRDDVDPNCLGVDGRTPLGCAALKGHEGVVKLFLEQENVDCNRRDVNGRTPLGCAAIEGHERVVKLLLDRKDVDPNRIDKYDLTPLVCATWNGHEEVVKLLLGRDDVDPNRLDVDGRTPLGCAALKGHEGVVKLFLEQENVDCNHRDVNGRTPLGCAAVNGHGAVVKLLLERGNVDPNRPDENDRTPLGCAAVEGHEQVVKLLLDRKDVDPNRQDKYDLTPLACAARNGHEEVVKILLECENVDPNHPDADGQTPLECAAVSGHVGVVELLLAREDVHTAGANYT